MASIAPRLKLYFEGSLGQLLVEHNLQKCWLQLPAVTSRGSKMQTVSDLITQIRTGFSLLSDIPNLHLELDGYTILEGTSLDLFRDGDMVTVKASQAALSLGQSEGNKRHRCEDSLPAIAADDGQPEPERPKKKRKVAKAAAQTAPPDGPVNDDAAAQPKSLAETPATDTQKKKKRKRKSTEGQETHPGAENENHNQSSSAQAGDASEAVADAPGADANSPADAEQKKQSRSARRKQLKRRFRRLGVAPPPQDPSSSSLLHSASVNLASTPAAAVPSSSDPNTAQPDQEVPTPTVSAFPPPPKRLKTQPGKLKAQQAGDGHVYFAESDDECDSADEDHTAHPKRAGNSNVHAEEQQSLQDQSGKQLAASKQKVPQEALPDGPNTTVPEEVQELKLGPKQPHLNGTHPKADSQSHQQGAGPSMPLPRTDTEYGALPVVEGPLQPGALVAYKLLEIGPDWAPQVSEWRQGEVDSTEDSGTVVIKPLAGQGRQVQGLNAEEEAEEEEEEDEGPPSSYDEEGVLTAELSSLSELRLIRPSTLAAAPQASSATAAPTETISTANTDTATVNTAASLETAANDTSAAAAAAQEDQTSGQQSNANMVPNVGAWAELSKQIARRKAELAKNAGGSSEAANGVQDGNAEAVVTEHKAMTVTGMQTPGAARPRGGVRASAMGPMLAFLRSSGGLETHAP